MKRLESKIVVLGLGYIGLPTASMFAVNGHHVVGVDVSPEVVATINSGNVHIVEPDLDILVRAAVNSGNLRASLTPEEAETFIIAVPTPFILGSGQSKIPDISYVESATRSLAPFLSPGNLVILESTSPVGTTDRILEIISNLRPDLPTHAVHVVHCPERVLPGYILRELVENDRIIGGATTAAAEKAHQLYRSFVKGNIFLTDSRTAELSKLVENSFRDVNIAFANELSLVCDRLGVDVWELIRLANRHPRVNILQPGPGVGGHCIAVDPWFIVASAPEEARLIRTAREINDAKPQWVVDKVVAATRKVPSPTVGCLGLAFKPNIDDLRESPALGIARELVSRGLSVMACEPNIAEHPEFQLYELDEVLQRANILVLLVDHDEFKAIDLAKLKDKLIIDTRGIFRIS